MLYEPILKNHRKMQIYTYMYINYITNLHKAILKKHHMGEGRGSELEAASDLLGAAPPATSPSPPHPHPSLSLSLLLSLFSSLSLSLPPSFPLSGLLGSASPHAADAPEQRSISGLNRGRYCFDIALMLRCPGAADAPCSGAAQHQRAGVRGRAASRTAREGPGCRPAPSAQRARPLSARRIVYHVYYLNYSIF